MKKTVKKTEIDEKTKAQRRLFTKDLPRGFIGVAIGVCGEVPPDPYGLRSEIDAVPPQCEDLAPSHAGVDADREEKTLEGERLQARQQLFV